MALRFVAFPMQAVILFVLAIAGLARAADEPASFTIDLPFQANAATPTWLGHPETPATTFATLNLPIQSPDPTAFLLVTVYFQEKDGGFLRLLWQGPQNAQVLSDNFYEGIGMSNQRSLLISPDILLGGGTLSFQCGDSALGIDHIRLQWMATQNGLVSPDIQDTLVTPSPGTTQPAQIFNGQPAPADLAAWKGQLVRVPITEAPERIEQGVEFSIQLDSVPAAGRLALQENGLPWGQHLVVWINQQRAGTITPAVPSLSDGGFLVGSNSANAYVGWRDGSLFVPPSLLKSGVDTVQFSVENDAPGTSDSSSAAPAILPLAVKNVVLQLNYVAPEAASVPASSPSPQTGPADAGTDISTPGSFAPTGPVTPTP